MALTFGVLRFRHSNDGQIGCQSFNMSVFLLFSNQSAACSHLFSAGCLVVCLSVSQSVIQVADTKINYLTYFYFITHLLYFTVNRFLTSFQ